jgi:uroporphyrinogen decarboxylase
MVMTGFSHKDKMTSRQRVMRTFEMGIPDRVPVNYMYNPGIDQRLKSHFGLNAADDEGLRQALGIDFRVINASYTGPSLHSTVADRKVDPLFGFHTRFVPNEFGGYWEQCDILLNEGDMDTALRWPFPDPDHFDYDSLEDQCEKYADYGLVLGNNGLGVVICRLAYYMGMSQALISLQLEDPAAITFIDRLLDFQLKHLERMLDKVGDKVQLVWMGEDLGTQIGPMISMKLFEKVILPRHQKFFDAANAYHLPVMLHTCGSSSWTYEKYIEAGLKAVDTLQPEAKNMGPRYLKDTFGGRLVFHGCISTKGALVNGSEQDVENEVRDTLAVMMPGGGYCLAPTHRLQDNTSVKNAVAMYRAAHQYGRYS